MCVFFSNVNSADEFHPPVISAMAHNLFVLVCGAVGLSTASGRSRVVLAALIPLVVLTAAHAGVYSHQFLQQQMFYCRESGYVHLRGLLYQWKLLSNDGKLGTECFWQCRSFPVHAG
jgi:hypothetical protein